MPCFAGTRAAAFSAAASPVLDLNFLTMAAFDPVVSFARSTTGTSFSPAGLLVTTAINLPRFDYDMATNASLGLLVEDAGTNYALWNRDLTNAAWVKVTMTTAKTSTGIDGGGSSCTRLTASGANATIKQTLTRVSAARITSAYIKRITGSGTINMTQDNGTTWTVVTATASWTRVTIPAATTANPIIGFRIVTSADAIDVDYVQHEEYPFQTSAIATTTVAVARGADVFSVPCVLPPFSGAIYVEAQTSPSTAGGGERAWSACDGTANNAVMINRVTTTCDYNFMTGGTYDASTDPNFGSLPANTIFKACSSWATNNAVSWVNGASSTRLEIVPIPPGINSLFLGTQANFAAFFNGWLRRVTVWRPRFTDGFCQAKST